MALCHLTVFAIVPLNRTLMIRPIRPCLMLLSLSLTVATVCGPQLVAQTTSPQHKPGTLAPPIPTKQWTGDLDELIKHRVVRVGVIYSKTFFYTVKGAGYGVSYETGKEFERFLNKKYPQQ